MFKSLYTELKKNLYLPYFLLGIVLVLVFCLMTDAVKGNDGKNYSVFEIILLSKRLRFKEDIQFSWVSIWGKGFGAWLKLIVPALVSLGFVLNNTEEKQAEHRYFLYSRESRLRYVISKLFGAALSAGFIFAVSNMLFGLIMLAFFPASSAYSEDLRTIIKMLYGNDSVSVHMLKVFFGSFMYGMYASCFTIFLSIFVSDRYVLLSIPVLFQYAADISVKKIWLKHLYSRYADAILAFDMSNIIRAFSHKYWWHEFAGVWIVLLFVGGIYYLAVNKEARP